MLPASTGEIDLEAFRSYLKLLADIQMNPRLRVKEDSSDVVQMTLFQAHKDLKSFRGTSEGELRAWLKTILTHTLINVAKKYKRQKRNAFIEVSIDQQLQESAIRILGELPADQTSPIQKVLLREQAELLADAMSHLLEDEYTAVLLKHVHDWKVAEIAERLGRSPEAVAGLLRRGLKKLRRSMTERSTDG